MTKMQNKPHGFSDRLVDRLTEIGFHFRGNDESRIYLGWRAIVTENIVTGFHLNGWKIDQTRVDALKASKTYFIISTGELVSDDEDMRNGAIKLLEDARKYLRDSEAARVYEEAWTAAHADELKAASAAGNQFPNCSIERYCVENGVDIPEDLDSVSELLNNVFTERWNTRAAESGLGVVIYNIMNDWRDGTL